MKQKIFSSLDAAVADIPDGARALCLADSAAPVSQQSDSSVVPARASKRSRRSAIIAARGEGELGSCSRMARCATSSPLSPARTPMTSRPLREGGSHLRTVPQGDSLRTECARAAGLLGLLHTVGVGTEVANGKEERVIDGKRCILESPCTAISL